MLKSRRYKRKHINLGCDVDFDIAGPSIRGALMLGYEGWLAGYQMNFVILKSQVTQSNFAVGYKTDEFQLHTNVNDGTEFGGSINQKVNKKLENAVNLARTAGNSSTHFGCLLFGQSEQLQHDWLRVHSDPKTRCQTDTVSPAGWQERQCRWPQAWFRTGISSISEY